MLKFTVAAVLSVFVSSAFASQAPVLSETQYGKIEFGQPLTKVEEVMGEDVTVEESGTPGCGYVRFTEYPNILFMVEDGVLTRGETDRAEIETFYGIKIGASGADVKSKAPNVVETEHAYSDGHYLTVTTPNGKNAMVFEEVQGTVDYIRAGVVPSAGYIEGCL